MKKIKDFLRRLAHAGTKQTNSNYLNRKIIITNQTAWLTVCLLSIYIVPIWIGIPIWRGMFMVGFTVNIFVLWLNKSSYNMPSRIIIAVFPAFSSVFYHGTTIGVGDPLNTVLHLNFFTTCLYPFLVFGLREKTPLILTSFIVSLLFLCFPFYADLIPKLLTDEQIELNRNTENFGYTSALITFYVLLVIQMTDSYKATKIHSILQEKSELQNQRMLESQKELNETLQELEQKRKEENQRGKISYWLTKINDILHTNDEKSDIYSKIISQIVEALAVNQGGIYSVNYDNENDIFIELTASYAFERQKFEQKRIQVGEGLLGQCYLEKENIILKDIPQNYTKITSGLGEATPSFLVIIPLKINDKVEGFIEIASFDILPDFQIEFLERAGENIASFMTSEKAQLRTRKLLRQSQLQAEELRIKEEEMRQNVEEMIATQEKVQQKEKDYLRQIKILEEELKTLES